MLLIRVVILGFLVGLHVVGGAVLFRRLFPRESPWWGFFIPMLALVSLLNFVEWFVALPTLAWLLPFSTGGLLWVMATTSWKRLRLPTAIFVLGFAFTLLIRCLEPDVNFYCTEGLTDLARIGDFCLGQTLPPTDSWLPPYPHVGYYTFMQYGASVLKRLLAIDVGTAYNLGFALVNALVLTATAAAAHTLSRGRTWVTVLAAIMMAGAFTGSTPILTLLHFSDPSPYLSIDITGGDDPNRPEFSWLLLRNPPDIAYRLYIPGCYIYYSEFHATQGGHLLALLSVFGVAELFRRRRLLMPWIYLAVAPVLAILTCTWFFLIVGLLAGPALLIALWAGRRPQRWPWVFIGALVPLTLLWPTLNAFIHGSAPQPGYLQLNLTSDVWTILIQGWPIYIPWLVLCAAWRRMSLGDRWLHFSLVPIFLVVELVYFTDRGTTLEKTWGATYGIGIAILYPLLFSQRGWFFRGASAGIIAAGLISLYAWVVSAWKEADWGSRDWPGTVMHIEGDYFIHHDNYGPDSVRDPQLHMMEEVLGGHLHGRTVLTGKAWNAFFESPALPAFTENRSYLGWTNAEETTGHPDEADKREKEINEFFDGTLPDPLGYLDAHDIDAVMIWPDDKITDTQLAGFKSELDTEFAYFDCKGVPSPSRPDYMPPLKNAGIFIRKSALGKDRDK